MRAHKYSYNYNININFPGARRFWGLEFTSLYKAERDGKYYLIIDNGTAAEFMDGDDPLLHELVEVIEFDTEEERDAQVVYVQRGASGFYFTEDED